MSVGRAGMLVGDAASNRLGNQSRPRRFTCRWPALILSGRHRNGSVSALAASCALERRSAGCVPALAAVWEGLRGAQDWP